MNKKDNANINYKWYKHVRKKSYALIFCNAIFGV